MLDDVISNLKSQVGPELMSKFGLSQEQADKSVEVAGESVTESVGKEMSFGKSGILDSLFSSNDNGDDENAVQGEMEGGMIEKLASKVGISKETAASIKDKIMPMIMSAVSSKMGSGGIASLLGGGDKKDGDGKDDGGGLMDTVKGFFG